MWKFLIDVLLALFGRYQAKKRKIKKYVHHSLPYSFNLENYTKSQIASRNNIDNTPTKEEIKNLKELHTNIVYPIMHKFGEERIVISSGFRCLELNRKIGSGDNSQHRKGQAVDLEVKRIDNYDLFHWIKENLIYDQMILNFIILLLMTL